MDYERLARMDELREANDRERDDMAVREARRVAGAEPEMWSLPKPAPTPQPRQPAADEINRLRSHDWVKFTDDRIALAIEPLLEAIGAAIAQERKRFDAEIVKLKNEFDLRISALLAEVDQLRRGELIDLPSPLRKRHAG